MSARKTRPGVLLVWTVAGLGAACSSGTAPGSAVATITVVLGNPALAVSQTTPAVATLRNADGDVLTGLQVAWASSATSVATVTSAGVVTAVAAGEATISATHGSTVGRAALTVHAIPVAAVTVTLPDGTLGVGRSMQASAILRDAGGSPVTDRVPVWTSSSEAVATISAAGLVTAVGVGQTMITATSGAASGSAPLTVTAVLVASVTVSLPAATLTTGQSAQAVATLRDGSGNVLTDRLVTWRAGAEGIVSISAAGLITGVAQGTTVVTAESEGVEGSAPLTILVPAGVLAAVRQAYQQEFGEDIPHPAVFYDPRAANCASGNHLATTAYLPISPDSALLLQMYLAPGGGPLISKRQVRIRKPSGSFRVLSVLLLYPETVLASDLSRWVAAQAWIDSHHAAFASSQGSATPMVTFVHSTVQLAGSQVPNPRSLAGITPGLAAQGITASNYDFVLVINIDPSRSEGGFASVGSAGGFVYMGNYSQWQQPLSESAYQGIARATYHHEIGHHWGWAHEWTPSCGGAQPAFSPFITAPILFGWLDVDGDGVPEIRDETPYGRPP